MRHGSGCILYHGELFICFLLVRILYQKPGRLNKGFFFLCLLMFLFFCVIWFAKGNCILLELSVQPSASKLECNFYDWILWINLKHANCSNKGFGEDAENPHSMWIELFEVIVYYYAGGCWCLFMNDAGSIEPLHSCQGKLVDVHWALWERMLSPKMKANGVENIQKTMIGFAYANYSERYYIHLFIVLHGHWIFS